MALYKNIANKPSSGTIEYEYAKQSEPPLYINVPTAGHYKIVFGGTADTDLIVRIADNSSGFDFWESIYIDLRTCRFAISDYEIYLPTNTNVYCVPFLNHSNWYKLFLEVVPVE